MACVCDHAHPQRTLLLDPPLPRHAAPCPSPTRRSKTIHLLTREDYERGCQHACTGVRCGREHGCGDVTRYKQACLRPTCGVERTPAPAGDRGECGGDGAGALPGARGSWPGRRHGRAPGEAANTGDAVHLRSKIKRRKRAGWKASLVTTNIWTLLSPHAGPQPATRVRGGQKCRRNAHPQNLKNVYFENGDAKTCAGARVCIDPHHI